MTSPVLAREPTVPPADDDLLTPIDRALQAQRELTAVERFSQRHAAEVIPRQARYYRDLLPAAPPGPGQQYRFEVDLDACTGCKACVSACHSLNGLDDDESFRSVGILVGGGSTPWQQTVTAACHHCVDPACLRGCPVDAYEKDPVTGIVIHLDDQCIGCSYCTLTCPYEVPRLNHERGIVRKCDLCRDRLAVGEAPACVQGCPNSAIAIGVVDRDEVVAAATVPDAALVASAPPSTLSLPATTYHTSRPVPSDAVAADHFAVRPARGHTPLAVMLVLTQLSVGAFASMALLRRAAPGALTNPIRPASAAVALAIGLLALGASVLHLGRPRHAWRAVIGLGHSWLSREIVAFGGFAVLAAADALALGLGAPPPVLLALELAVLLAGGVGLACSTMIYAVTGRRWWRWRTTAAKFVLGAASSGASFSVVVAASAAAVAPGAVASSAVHGLLVIVVAAGLAKLGAEAAVLTHLADPSSNELSRTARLLAGPLRGVTRARFALGLAGGLVLPLVEWGLWSEPPRPAGWAIATAVVAMACVVAGELAERRTFFTAVSSPRMPGGLR
jgi:Fe-S-cluster-containing dehydrogenase component/DMSO reductase anchor subunit